DFVATIGEFIGTSMFLFFAYAGTQVANVNSAAQDSNSTTNASTGFSPEVLLYIALIFAFSLMVNVWVFFRISGGLFNPAVTFGMMLVRSVSFVRGMLLIGAQICGSIFASYIVSVLFPTNFNVRTTLSTGTSLTQGVFIEALLTAELVFTIFMLAKEKHKATFIAPVGIGLALFIGELVGVYYTGGSLNPARSFGPCVVSGIWDHEHWIYWIGPALGAIFAVAFYRFIKMLEYEMVNPGQDDNHIEAREKEIQEEEETREQSGSRQEVASKTSREDMTSAGGTFRGTKRRFTGDV
ncbi:aquaporin-like protein, partial [Saccharata proteae CBS 121410]